MSYLLINHLAILETRNMPNVATVVPTIKVVPFLFQKSLPSWITYFVSALISLAASERSFLNVI